MNNPTPAHPSRRTVLALSGLVALLSGIGVSHWMTQRRRLSTEAEQALWAYEFSLTDGPTLAMAEWQGHPVVLNFWATWCPPCVEEMPLLDAFYRQNSSKGWKMLGIALDQPSQVKRFLGQHSFAYPMAWGGLDGSQLAELLGNESGSLPFTVVLAADGRLIQRKLGKLSANDIQKWG
jgi:thiol-disulfide isomerase/thioredoxin